MAAQRPPGSKAPGVIVKVGPGGGRFFTEATVKCATSPCPRVTTPDRSRQPQIAAVAFTNFAPTHHCNVLFDPCAAVWRRGWDSNPPTTVPSPARTNSGQLEPTVIRFAPTRIHLEPTVIPIAPTGTCCTDLTESSCCLFCGRVLGERLLPGADRLTRLRGCGFAIEHDVPRAEPAAVEFFVAVLILAKRGPLQADAGKQAS